MWQPMHLLVGGMPATLLRRVEAEIGVTDADAVTAEGAGMTVGFDDFGAEGGYAGAGGGGFQVQAGGGEDFFVEGVGEMCREKSGGDLVEKERIAT